MGVIDWVISIYVVATCLFLCLSYLSGFRIAKSLLIFEHQSPKELLQWPKLSVIVAACNEEATIRQTVVTLLQQNYPELEIILVNDRSSDATGEIIQDIADADSRVVALHIDYLPAGWLGKVHAFHKATEIAGGDWILYTDADIHFQESVLRKALSLVLEKQSDHLAILPASHTQSFWLDVVVQYFGTMLIQGARVEKIEKPDSCTFIGIGAFNLVRASSLKATDGFPWLRMEVADDIGLGLMLRQSGARSSFAISTKAISLEWYDSLSSMFKGLEKNMYGAALYSPSRMIALVLFLWGLALGPLVAVLYTNAPYLWILGVMIYLLMGVRAILLKKRFGQRILPALFIQAAQVLFSLMVLWSGIMCMRRGGIRWRDTFYKLEDLRAGQRFKGFV